MLELTLPKNRIFRQFLDTFSSEVSVEGKDSEADYRLSGEQPLKLEVSSNLVGR